MNKVVACHQPNFIPWMGFFAKVIRADAFVLLDDVQFTQGHNKHNWTTRVQVLTSNGPLWLSMPTRRSGLGAQEISKLRTIDDDVRWLKKLIKTMEISYGKTPYYQEVSPPLLKILARHDGSVCKTNIEIIKTITSMLELDVEIFLSSETQIEEGTSNQRLINLTLALSGTEYLSGDGAEDYQVTEQFEEAGIRLKKLGFKHPEYHQVFSDNFEPGLSIFDSLCNSGINGTRDMLLQSTSR
jgi:hypothetical protein